MRTSLAALFVFPLLAPAADPSPFAGVNPNAVPADDPRAKELPRMLVADARRRMQEANLRESKAFAAVTTREQWEAYRDERLAALKESLGAFPLVPRKMRTVVTKKHAGDRFVIHNVVYETRPGLWAAANLYLPAAPPAKMPGLLISHSHHTPKTHGELQDMGMTWARAGCAVLVPDHLGHGERRQHDFRTEADYPKAFRPGRQDYYFRYNSALQLSSVGESLLGWMAWDLMRGVDVLLEQLGIDPGRILLLGAVAGGGDPAGVTAALDPRIACVVPFNFGGWQPESSVTANPDRDFAWFGEGYWESTRGLKGGAAGGFAHFVIVGGVAPRRVVYAHEFAWDAKTDPAWPRLQKVFDFYDAKSHLAVAHGAGRVSGAAGPENTHCTHIGAVHRAQFYPALKAWFDMPIPEEYSKRLPTDDLMCWTDAAVAELKPRKLHEVLTTLVRATVHAEVTVLPAERPAWSRTAWKKVLGNIDPGHIPNAAEGKTEDVPGGNLTRFVLEVEPGIVVPLLLLTPANADGKLPAVVMVAQAGKAAFLKERGDVIAAFLKAGVVVCLADVRGTGETQPGNGSPERGGSRTSVSQTNLILGQPLLGSQFRDLRTVIAWLARREGIDGKRLAVWGDSFARVNDRSAPFAAPLDAPDLPAVAEPGAAHLAFLAGLFEDGVTAVFTRGGLGGYNLLLESPYLYVPHDAVVPGAMRAVDLGIPFLDPGRRVWSALSVDGRNRSVGFRETPPIETAAEVVKYLIGK